MTEIDATLDQIARRYGVEMILQFGSSITGPAHARSDVDIAVLLERPSIPLRERADLAGALQALFPGHDVDLAVINHADPLFLKKVTEHCRLLFGSSRRLAELRLYAFRRYQDHRKYLALEREYVARALGDAGDS